MVSDDGGDEASYSGRRSERSEGSGSGGKSQSHASESEDKDRTTPTSTEASKEEVSVQRAPSRGAQLQAERQRVHKAAEQRPVWRPQLAPKDRGPWNGRHKLVYSNDGMNPNVRSYFDRYLDPKLPGMEGNGALKPSWRLTTEGVPEEERAAMKAAMQSMSPLGHAKPESPKKGGSTTRIRHLPPDRPWEQEPAPLPEGHEVRLPGPGGAGGARAVPPAPSPAEAEGSAAAAFFQAPPAGGYAAPDVGDWDSHHHVLWCNEQKVGDYKRLNPPQFRSYFDRMRTPDVGARSCEMRRRRPDGAPEVSRIIPAWRLEAIIGHGGALLTPEDLQARPDPVPPHTGTGGSPVSPNASKGSLSGVSKSSGSSHTIGRSSWASQPRCEGKWNPRHDLTFRNEEVSRLDRSYFDRFREPDCVLDPDQAKREARGSVRLWSLEHEGSPEEVAEAVCKGSDERCSPDGRWNNRHHLMFCNNTHPNDRSYFERWREPPDYALPAHAPEVRREAPALPTDDRSRGALGPSAPAPHRGHGAEALLLRCDSEPDTRAAKRKERRRAAWFSSHAVVF